MAGSLHITGTKRGTELYLPPALAELKRRFVEKQKDETIIEIIMRIPRKSKSQKQLGAYFGLLLKQACIELADKGIDTSFIYGLDKPTGVAIKEEQLKDYLYSRCPMFEGGKHITLSSDECTTEHAAKFFDDCRNFLASQFGIIIPDPDPSYKLRKTK